MSLGIDSAPLAGRVILVTGALGGLGTAASKAIAQAGATVVLLGRRVRPLEKLHDAIAAIARWTWKAHRPTISPNSRTASTRPTGASTASCIARPISAA